MENLITLCGKRCHFVFGHFCDWRSWNQDVLNDCDKYNSKRIARPIKIKKNRNRSSFVDAMLSNWN